MKQPTGKQIATHVVVLLVGLGIGASTSGDQPTAQAASSDRVLASDSVLGVVPESTPTTTNGTPKTTTTVPVTTTTTAPAASSCDVAREAFLTGSQAEIEAALRTLQADRSADATAREYADNYLNRDADDPGFRKADISIIRMACD